MSALAPASATFGGSHLWEFLPPLISCGLYLLLYERRVQTLAAEGRPIEPWRAICFATGAITAAAVQLPPFDTLADQILIAHMIQHIIIGDLCSLLIVLGLTGPVLQPLLHLRISRPIRVLASPVIALVLWAVDLYGWHLPIMYQLAIRHDLVHAAEHACLLWFGSLLWLALIGPLPKPKWFTGFGKLAYVIMVRFVGTVLANILIWSQTVFYPVYKITDAARGLNPLSDQNLAGAVMMIEQSILTLFLLGWLFFRFAARDEERQALMDLAAEQGVELTDERASRAAEAGQADRLRDRILELGRDAPPPDRDEAQAPTQSS